jgi:hypothetical protein
VTGDVHHVGLTVPPRDEFFVNSRQTDLDWPWMVMVTRAKAAPDAMVHDMRALVASTDGSVPVLRVTPMAEIVSGTMAEPGLYARCSASSLAWRSRWRPSGSTAC